MMKRIICTTLAIFIFFTIPACSQKESDSVQSGEPQQVSQEELQKPLAVEVESESESEPESAVTELIQASDEPPSEPVIQQESWSEQSITEFRQSIPYKWDLVTDYRYSDNNGYFNIDRNVGKLEDYLECFYSSPVRWRADEEIPDIAKENELIFMAAAYNTNSFSLDNAPWEELSLTDNRVIIKEHINETAQFMFGENCKIDYANLKQIDMYSYHEQYGIVSMSAYLVKGSHIPIIIRYKDYGKYYETTVVFPEWSGFLPENEYCYFYEDGTGLYFNEREMEYYCYNILPQYTIQINKGREGQLYFKSCLLKDTAANQGTVNH